MTIIEKDIFNYVFFPNLLDDRKVLYLANNELLKKEIELLQNIKMEFPKIISSEIIEEIKRRIEKNRTKKIIRLIKNNYIIPIKSSHLILAADSPKLHKRQSVETFEDEDSKYLIKIITNMDSNRVFLFNKDNKEMHNIRIKLDPSGQSFIMQSSNEPIVISPKQEISNIYLMEEES